MWVKALSMGPIKACDLHFCILFSMILFMTDSYVESFIELTLSSFGEQPILNGVLQLIKSLVVLDMVKGHGLLK